MVQNFSRLALHRFVKAEVTCATQSGFMLCGDQCLDPMDAAGGTPRGRSPTENVSRDAVARLLSRPRPVKSRRSKDAAGGTRRLVWAIRRRPHQTACCRPFEFPSSRAAATHVRSYRSGISQQPARRHGPARTRGPVPTRALPINWQFHNASPSYSFRLKPPLENDGQPFGLHLNTISNCCLRASIREPSIRAGCLPVPARIQKHLGSLFDWHLPDASTVAGEFAYSTIRALQLIA